jgi:RimJ/RimL family protein N-acetyltransferase
VKGDTPKEEQRAMTPVETVRLRLRNLVSRDLETFLHYRQDPAVARYQGWSDYTRADAEAFFEAQGRATFGAAGTWYQVGIADRSSDALLGDCAVHFVDDRQVELGFTLATEHQGQGFMTEAARAMLEVLFGQRNAHRVTALTDARNAACVDLLERLGFRREAHYRKNVFFKGEWGDEFLYALLAEEWRRDPKLKAPG